MAATTTDAFANFKLLRTVGKHLTTYGWRGWEIDCWDGWHCVLLSPYEPAMRFADTVDELAAFAVETEAKR